MNTVSLCMIVKNEDHNIAALMDDVCPVLEEVIVVDTGSTDGTLGILAEKQEQYPNLKLEHFEWVDNFSEARNFSFGFATQDWIFWMDGDDRINPQELTHFKENVLDQHNVDAWILPYIYDKNRDGSSSLTLGRERFVKRSKNLKWSGAIHETINFWGTNHQEYPLEVHHNRTGKKFDLGRNLRILEKEYAKNPSDPRTAYYTAKERFDSMKPTAKEALIHYLTLPGKYYDDEIGARFRLAKTYLAEQDHGSAIRTIEPVYHLDATRKRAEYYFIFGQVEYDLRNYEIAIDWYERCLKKLPPSSKVINLEYWTWHPLKKIAMCYDHLGDWDQAAYYAKKTLENIQGDSETVKWAKSLTRRVMPNRDNQPLVTLEFGSQIRFDSYRYREDFEKCALNDLPFEDFSLDGIVIFDNLVQPAEAQRLVKPGGFLWSDRHIPTEKTDFQFLTNTKYLDKEYNIFSYVKADLTKPLIAYQDGSPHDGPYRYRVLNLIKAAIKRGFPTLKINQPMIPEEAYIFVAMNFSTFHKNHSTVYVLETCEKLPDGKTYESYGVEKADVVNCSSAKLAEHLQSIYPDKPVINIDDHFELPSRGWL